MPSQERERSKHAPQIIARDQNVTVIDDDVLVARLRQHLSKITDFAVEAQHVRTMHDSQLRLGKFLA